MATSPAEPANNNDLISTGITDAQGNPYYRGIKTPTRVGGNNVPPPGGGGGGDDIKPAWKLDVPRDVQWMKALFALLIPALGAFLFYFISEMKDVRKDISNVSAGVAAQSSSIGAMGQSLTRIESRLDARYDEQPKENARSTEAGAVRQSGTDSRQ